MQMGYDRMDQSPFRLAMDGAPEAAPEPARSPSDFQREMMVRGILQMLKREGHPNYRAIKKEMLALLGGAIAQDDPPASNPTPPPTRLPGGSLLAPGGEEGLALRQNAGRAEAAAPDPDFSAADAMFPDARRLLSTDHGSPAPAPVGGDHAGMREMFPDAGRIRRL
jgi:hypothetical protein